MSSSTSLSSSSPHRSGTGPAHLGARADAGTADHLRVDGVSRSYPDRRVLTDISFTVSAGERACLIGENGTGKSTLLRIIAGLDEEHGGTVHAPGGVGLYHQEPPFDPEHTVKQVLANAVQKQHELVARIETLGEQLAVAPNDERLAADYDAALALAVRTDAWSADQHAEQLVQGLGLAHLERVRPARELSGGQLSRLSLAWLLLRRPDTLLLDEPTNHLDAAATVLLVELLVSWTGPVLIASHDRAFLDEVATTLLDLDPAPREHRVVQAVAGEGPTSGHGLTRFTGRYTDYLLARIAERERWERRYRDEQAELKRLRAEVAASHTVGNASRGPRTEARASRKFYSDRNAKVVSRRVNDAATALDRLEQTQVRRPPEVLHFAGLAPGTSARGIASVETATGPILTATQVRLDGRLAPTSLSLGARDRLLIAGPNGAGKSTLLNILVGHLNPDGGSLTMAANLTVGLLGQDTDDGAGGVEGAHSAETVAESYRRRVGEDRAEAVPLSTFGLIAGRDHGRRVRDLSVGQRRRLDLAVLLAEPPQVLLLDEPTNHFSLLLATQLEASIPDYPGAVVVASHDRWLQHSWAGERLTLTPLG